MKNESQINNAKKIRIPLHNIQIGMTVAEDILNSNGLLLISCGTKINDTHMINLRLYQVNYIYVYDIPPDIPEQNIPKIPESNSFHKENEGFAEFESSYSDNLILTSQYLSHISQGSDVRFNDLFKLSDGLINKLNSFGDLFNYFYHLKQFDDYTYTHCLNVSMLCNIFGKWLKFPEERLKNLTVAGLLHDIGKLSIDKEVLNKPGKLSDSEFDLIKRHTVIGYELIKDYNLPEEVKLAVLQHHEKFDGSGYPQGLTNEQVCDLSKIVAIMDIYDALTSDRSYHKRMCPFKVINILEKDGFNALDTGYIFTFLENITQTFIGNYVLLTGNKVGKVVFVNKGSPSKPLVDVSGKILNLAQDPSIEIIEIL